MSTLQEIIDSNPNKLFSVENSGIVYTFNRLKKNDASNALLVNQSDNSINEFLVSSTGWDLHISAIDLVAHREECKRDIDIACSNKRKEFITPNQDLTYANKQLEAQAFKDAGYPEGEVNDTFPYSGKWRYTSSYKNAKGLTSGQESADIVLAKVSQLSDLDALMDYYKFVGKEGIDSAIDDISATAARDTAVNNIGAIGS